MSSRVEISFCHAENTSVTSPATVPIAVCGKLEMLHQVSFDSIKHRLEPQVTAALWKKALFQLNPSPTDRTSLYLSSAYVCALPSKMSRHISSSGSIYFNRVIRFFTGVLIVVCNRNEVIPLASAIARSYPVYSQRTTLKKVKQLRVEFLVVEDYQPVSLKEMKERMEGGLDMLPKRSLSHLDLETTKMLTHLTESIRLAGKIVDMPCNEMHTDAFVEEAKLVAVETKSKMRLIRGTELKDQGFGGLWNVGKAATRPPALVVLSHEPDGAKTTISWVGKGIVYDTGGLSIKGKATMPGMKRDCGGAAAILGAYRTAVQMGFKETLHCVLCLAENAVGPESMRPDDIITLYSGKTVEVNNTDAEGRLVLGDGVAYASKELKSDIIVDLATLTGTQSITTGKYHGAVLSNLEQWETHCLHSGKASGDHAYPIIYCPEFQFTEFASHVADMKNSVNDRMNAQTSCAGIFIHSHLEDGFDFTGVALHVDMAGPAASGERATSWGVSFLLTLFGQYSGNSSIRAIAPEISTDEIPTKKRRLDQIYNTTQTHHVLVPNSVQLPEN